MAIFQPTNITPSSFSGVGAGTVASSDDVVISWQVNGNSPLTAFSIDIYDNTPASAPVHSTGVISSGYGLPFYPTDSKGNPQFISYAPEESWGSINIVDGNKYKLKITQFWGSDFSVASTTQVVQYSESAFICRTLPTLSIDAFSDPILSVQNVFTASYAQAQGDTINWVRWQFASVDIYGNITMLDDTGEVNTALLSYTVDGLLEGVSYQVKVTVETSSGVQVSTDWKSFTVQYSNAVISGELTTEIQSDGSILLDMTNIALPTSTNLFDEENIFGGIEGMQRENGFYVFSATAAKNAYGGSGVGISQLTPLFNADTQYTFSASCRVEPTSASAVRFRLIVYYTDSTTSSLELDNTTLTTQSLTTDAGKTISYVRMFSNADGTVYVQNMWLNEGAEMLPYEPYVASNTQISDFTIYRKTGNSLTLESVATVPYTTKQFKDFSAVSGQKYVYELFAVLSNEDSSNNSLSAPIESQTTGIIYRAYQLIEATIDDNEPNVYHALNVWLFGNNIEAGSVSNNNTPTFLPNFTKYPFRQTNTQAPKSGVLQALLSNVSNFTYKDTAQQMEALYSISLSTNTFFIKDMKGNIYMVGVSDAITQTINTKTAVQQVSVSIPWQETGSAQDAVIIQLPTDDGWQGENEVFAVKLSVDINTGMLVATYETDAPIEYSLTGKDQNVLTVTGEDKYIDVTTFELTNGQLIASN